MLNKDRMIVQDSIADLKWFLICGLNSMDGKRSFVDSSSVKAKIAVYINVLIDDVQIKELTNIAHNHNFTTQ